MADGRIVIVGGGLAAARAAHAYREAGGDAHVTIVAAERHAPYSRPPLSKRLLRGETEADGTLVAPAEDYAEKGVELLLETEAAGLDLTAREVVLAGGGRLPFGRLVIATGAAPRALPVPGAELEGVHLLRTLDDSLAIRRRAADARRAVVVGTGFVGLEVSSSLRTLGVEVTIVDPGTAPFRAVRSAAFSDHLARRAREEGAELLLGDGLAAFLGDGSLGGARTESGRELEADLAVVGIGVTPSTGWLAGTGLADGDGVPVDARFRTAVDGVHAIGDVARFRDPVLGLEHRIEHYSNADHHGRQLGKLLAGDDAPYDKVASFFTELFGRQYKVLGHTPAGAEQRLEGDFDAGEAVLHYLDGDRLRGALLTGQSEEREAELLERIRADGRG